MNLWAGNSGNAARFDGRRLFKELSADAPTDVSSSNIVDDVKQRGASVVAVYLVQFNTAG